MNYGWFKNNVTNKLFVYTSYIYIYIYIYKLEFTLNNQLGLTRH